MLTCWYIFTPIKLYHCSLVQFSEFASVNLLASYESDFKAIFSKTSFHFLENARSELHPYSSCPISIGVATVVTALKPSRHWWNYCQSNRMRLHVLSWCQPCCSICGQNKTDQFKIMYDSTLSSRLSRAQDQTSMPASSTVHSEWIYAVLVVFFTTLFRIKLAICVCSVIITVTVWVIFI